MDVPVIPASGFKGNIVSQMCIRDRTDTETPTQGDAALTTGGGNAKTGEATPIALAVAAVSLVGAALFISKKRSR